MRDWERILTPADKDLYARGLFGERQMLDGKLAVLIVDVTRAFVGTRPLPILEAVAEYPTSCGERGWAALPKLAALADAARSAQIPVIYTRNDQERQRFTSGVIKQEDSDSPQVVDPHAQDFPDMIAPHPGELVIEKTKASAFFCTPLEVCLRHMGVDSLIIGGSTTSGCVRASAVDAHSLGFTVFVVEDCCFDRFEISHLAALFDLNAKYATVLNLAEVIDCFQEPAVRTKLPRVG